MSSVRDFYDRLANDYHTIFADWDASMSSQAKALTGLVGPQGKQILDCACGIGTQAIGLAMSGYDVVGTDLSPLAVDRAAREAAHRGITLPTGAADMRQLPFEDSCFDVVLCADNAVTHLLGPDDVLAALSSMRRVMARDGTLVLTMRGDYEKLRAQRVTSAPAQVSQDHYGRTVSFQLWHWHDDGEHYDLEHFQLHDEADGWRVVVRKTTSWAMVPEQVSEFARAAGFSDIRWHEPETSGFYQHVMTARAAKPVA